ncbi:MAG: amidohydrolase [Syntrophaceticus sp.]|nr:amidohydrolase [Syntrophaceticus sp.]MDD3314206.1 amidohydrolase [Syntrophaceticus sp.]MDD4360335.1 amidohydrolase [Syntrophaceticus sp.]MDD4783191.1 amidohydrolase [Syntrophaceticus sp.]
MIALINGNIMTMAGHVYNRGSIIVKDQKIDALSLDSSSPVEAQVIDVSGKYVLPGFIDAHTHAGIYEEIYAIEGDDTNEASDPITPHLRAIDAVNMEDLAFNDALRSGVTTVMTGPGSANVIGGLSLVMKTCAKTADQAVIKNPVGLKVAFGENPKRVYGDQKKAPMTRMATAALLRETLTAAQNYAAKIKHGEKNPDKLPDRDLKMEAMLPVIGGEIPLLIHAHRADDIITGLRIADEFNLKVSIQHGTEAYKIPEELVSRDIPAVVGPSLCSRAKVELKDLSLKTPGILSQAGIKVAIITDHPVVPVQYLSLMASLAVKEGMDEQEALKAITINPAEILGVADRVGSLEAGKDADIIVLSGHPLDWRTKVELVLVNGKIVYADEAHRGDPSRGRF